MIRYNELKGTRKSGIEKGDVNRNLEMVQNLLTINVIIKNIFLVTGLTEKEVESLV